MKTALKLSFLAFAISIGINANAQSATASSYGYNGEEGGTAFGIKSGINFSTFTGDGVDDLDSKAGFNIGVFVERMLSYNTYILTGLEFTAKGAKYEEKDGSEKWKITLSPLYLQLPIHMGYKMGLTDEISLGLHAGPYLAYGIGGKWKYEYTDSDYPKDNEKEEEDFFGSEEEGGYKSFDLGVGFGADIMINKLQIGIGYDLGVLNIGRDDDSSVKNLNFFLSVGYKF